MKRLAAAVLWTAIGAATLSAAAPVTALAFDPTGERLAGGGQKLIALHSVRGTNAPMLLRTELAKLTALQFHPRQDWLAAAGGSPGVAGKAAVFDLRSQRTIVELAHGSEIAGALSFASAGDRLAAAFGQVVRIYRLTNGAADLAFELSGHSSPALAVKFSPDDSLLVTAGRDRSVKVWSASDGRLLRSFGHHTEAIHALAFRPLINGGPLACATGGDDRTIRIWQPEIGRMVRIVRHHAGSILA